LPKGIAYQENLVNPDEERDLVALLQDAVQAL
jgi:hypothetical protein